MADWDMHVFVDATPSEQLGHPDGTVLCLAGVLVFDESKIKNLHQYKDVPATDRPATCRALSRQFQSGSPDVLASGAYSRIECVEEIGRRVLASAGVTRIATGYLLDGTRLADKTAVALGWYAAGLACIAASAAKWAKAYDLRRVAMFVDHFPGSDRQSLKFIGRAIERGEVRESWNTLIPALDLDELYVDTLVSYVDSGGTTRSGKEHPGAAVVDWISHALFAFTNAADRLDGVGRSHWYRLNQARVWSRLARAKRAEAVSLDALVGRSDPCDPARSSRALRLALLLLLALALLSIAA